MSTFEQFVSQQLNESRAAWNRSRNSSAILPAGRILFGKNKVAPDHVVSKEAGVWGDGPQSVRTYKHVTWKPSDKHGNGGGDQEKFFHVSSYGHYDPAKDPVKIGQDEEFHHDQSMNRLPTAKLVGVSNYTDGKKIGHHGEDHSKTKAALHVYK